MFGSYKYGGLDIDVDRFPAAVQLNFIQRTVAHKLGNEVKSAMIREKEKAEKDGRVLDADEEEALQTKLREEMLAKFYAGTVGLRISGPRGTTLENIAFELAYEHARKVFEPKGLWPKPDRKAGITAEEATVIFQGEAMTRENLADLALEKYQERFMAEAEVERKARIEKAKANKAAAIPVKKEGTQESAADLL